MRYCFLALSDMGRTSNLRLVNLGREMAARGCRVSYLIEDYPSNKAFAPFAGAEVVAVSPKLTPRVLAERRAALRRLRPDYVHVLNPSFKAMLALAGHPAKVVGDWEEWRVLTDMGGGRGRAALDRVVDRWMLRRSHLHVVVSRYLEREFRQREGIEALYLPYATYLHDWPDPPPPAVPFAAYLGNLEPRFDVDLLFDAARLLKSQGMTPRIEAIGKGAQFERWQRFVRDEGLDNVVLHGFLDWPEACRILRQAHVLVFPIRPTPFNLSRCPGKTYAYAQAARPIITCRVGEVPEVLGETATYIEPTPDPFATALQRAMSSARQPDVDYHVERQNWSARADRLLRALRS